MRCHRRPADPGRFPVAAVRGAELRLRRQGHGRAVQRRRARQHLRPTGDPRPRAPGQRQDQPDRARLHPLQRPRPVARPLGRRAEGGRRPDGAVVRGRRLRRLRRRRDLRAGRLRGLRDVRRAGTPAPRPVPQGVRGPDAARPSRPEARRTRRLAPPRRRLIADIAAVRAPRRSPRSRRGTAGWRGRRRSSASRPAPPPAACAGESPARPGCPPPASAARSPSPDPAAPSPLPPDSPGCCARSARSAPKADFPLFSNWLTLFHAPNSQAMLTKYCPKIARLLGLAFRFCPSEGLPGYVRSVPVQR